MSFYLTTPIYYVNSTPHIGHAYTTIAADILVRHHRQRGEETFFLTGVDEHASKVARVAAEQGLEPKEYADRIVGRLARAARRAQRVERLLHPHDRRGPQALRPGLPAAHLRQRRRLPGRLRRALLRRLRGVQDREPSSSTASAPTTAIEPEWIEETNWFFRLSAYQERLLALYDERPDFVLPGFRCNEAGASSRAACRTSRSAARASPGASRSRGIRSQVAYVWADALVNYLSALTLRAARRGPARDASGPTSGTCSARTSCASTASTGRRCCSRPATTLPKQLFVHGYLHARRPQDLEVARQRRSTRST